MKFAYDVTWYRRDDYKILVGKPQRRLRLEDILISTATEHREWFIYVR